MTYKYEYKTDDERTNVISQNKDKTLIEEQNIIEGNFLIFSDVKPLENQLKDLQDNQLILMNAVADLYTQISSTNTTTK